MLAVSSSKSGWRLAEVDVDLRTVVVHEAMHEQALMARLQLEGQVSPPSDPAPNGPRRDAEVQRALTRASTHTHTHTPHINQHSVESGGIVDRHAL